MDTSGLTAAQAAQRLAHDGPNTLPAAGRRSALRLSVDVLEEPMFLLLIAAGAIYLFLGELREALVLGASIAAIVAITIVQELKAERALEALRDLSTPHAFVLRDGQRLRIPGHEVVRGDVTFVAEGDRVVADGVLHGVNELEVDESLLTGESLPVAKRAGERIFAGTLAVKGQGTAQVDATGPRTELGKIGLTLAGVSSEPTALQRETGRMVKLVAFAAAAACIALVLIHFSMRGEWIPALLSGLTLAMALVPEEFPVVLTIFLALGAWRIARQGVLTRRMPAIEMLGAATVLCVDKTGTLTENRMSVVETPQETIDLAALACEIEPFDAMDRAIVAAASAAARDRRKHWRLERDYPMRPDFLAVCHAWRTPQGELRVALKGAPETVLRLCGRQDLLDETRSAASRGLRLLGVAQGSAQGPLPDDPAQVRFSWVGFLAFADPLRASVPEAVALCRRAGIRVVMITGDHPGTAAEIARQAGLSNGGVLTGADIAAMDAAALARAVERTSVFARVLPQQKLKLVEAYKAAGEVVAMTGDGVNDAPALKSAHIGVAMGRRGSDVAREAAALVLLDDNFGSLVQTVRLGRRIYDNIRSAMRYIVSVHVPTAGMAFLPLVFGWPALLFPVHIVFLEFVIDPTCSVAFEAEPGDPQAMSRPPRDPAERMFDARMLAESLLLGVVMLAAVFALYAWALRSGRGEELARAMGFSALVLGNFSLIFAYRARGGSLWRSIRVPNAAMWWILSAAAAALLAALYVPDVAALFRFAAPGAAELGLSLAAGLCVIAGYELLRLTSALARRYFVPARQRR